MQVQSIQWPVHSSAHTDVAQFLLRMDLGTRRWSLPEMIRGKENCRTWFANQFQDLFRIVVSIQLCVQKYSIAALVLQQYKTNFLMNWRDMNKHQFIACSVEEAFSLDSDPQRNASILWPNLFDEIELIKKMPYKCNDINGDSKWQTGVTVHPVSSTL